MLSLAVYLGGTMKRLTYDEFQSRVSDAIKAREIFIRSGITNNISVAFELYQALLAEEKKQTFISRMDNPISDAERPECSECGEPLKLDPNPKVIEGEAYPTTWICTKCGVEYYTKKTVEEWIEELK